MRSEYKDASIWHCVLCMPILKLFYFYKEHLDQLPAKYLRMMDEGESAERVVADYIAGMTDQYAITKFSEYFLPQAWQVDGY